MEIKHMIIYCLQIYVYKSMKGKKTTNSQNL